MFHRPGGGAGSVNDDYFYYKIELGKTVIVSENVEHIITEDLELIGDIEVIGVLTLLDLDELRTPHVLETTVDVTLTNGNDFVLCDGSSNTVTVTLPAAASNIAKVYSIKAIDTTYTVIVDGDGSETIDGSTTKTILLNATMKIVSTGTEWFIV